MAWPQRSRQGALLAKLLHDLTSPRSQRSDGSTLIRRLHAICTGNVRMGIGDGTVPRPKLIAWRSANRRGSVATRSVCATVAKAAKK